jgi:AraC-like DNA-binding protein
MANMAYDLTLLAQAVVEHLGDPPYPTLESIAQTLCVNRRTLLRALRLRFGWSFRELRNHCLRAAALDAFAVHPEESIKQVAGRLGYSAFHPESFGRRLRSVDGGSPTATRRAARCRR